MGQDGTHHSCKTMTAGRWAGPPTYAGAPCKDSLVKAAALVLCLKPAKPRISSATRASPSRVKARRLRAACS